MIRINPMISIISVIILLFLSTSSEAASKECSTFTCGSLISKCQLLEACRCEAQLNFTCHETCTSCLGDLFQECCSCVGICPTTVESEYPSHVKVLNQTSAELFDIYADEEDLSEHRTVHRELIKTSNSTTSHNCVMAFLSSCVTQDKCETSCISLGASGYRWFEVGCCECLGYHCPGFGINQLRCKNCPLADQVIDSDL